MEIGPALGKKKIRFGVFFFPKLGPLDAAQARPILQGNPKADFLEEYRSNLHLAEVHYYLL
jgi:hypothetical protein